MISSFGAKEHQSVGELPLGFGACKRRQQRGGADEEYGVASFEDRAAQRNG